MRASFIVIDLAEFTVSVLRIKARSHALTMEDQLSSAPLFNFLLGLFQQPGSYISPSVFLADRESPQHIGRASLFIKNTAGSHRVASIVYHNMCRCRVNAVKLFQKTLFFYKDFPADSGSIRR